MSRQSSHNKTLKVLWLAPNFNHYKARFLNHLAEDETVNLTILSGTGRDNMGDQEIEENWSFKHVKLDVSKRDFGKSQQVKQHLKRMFADFDWILLPAEKKNLPLFLYVLKLRRQHRKVQLFSYNHAKLKSKQSLLSFLDRWLSKFFNKHLDRVIFYNENACQQAVRQNLISFEKAFWANNTVDDTEIAKHYQFELPPEKPLTLLFIGRLIASKRISEAIVYFEALQEHFPQLRLEIIGDGPERAIVETAMATNAHINWHGTLVDEADIAPIMKKATLVFVPGLSGLSINHAFAYGRPYITLTADKHGPELSYLDHGSNGYVLDDHLDEDVAKLKSILQDRDQIVTLCNNAYDKGKMLSVEQWVKQLKSSLLYEG
ncbi:glycosyltransferase family 4 protein [Psychroserpens sp. BH13MA-6]